MNLHYAAVAGVGVSKIHTETAERAYFDGTFTSNTPDQQARVVHASNFAAIVEQIKAGVRVLDSHKHESNGIGKTIDARVVENQVDGTFYVLKGMTIDGEFHDMELESQSYKTTKSWIMGLKDGMLDKLSMGWFSERDICNLCDQNVWRYPCRHYPGERFPITDDETGEEIMELCTYSCYGVTAVEVSVVYFGANPDARLVAKAKELAPEWESEQIDRVESQLKVAIVDDNQRSYFDMALPKETQVAIEAAIKEAIGPAVKTAMESSGVQTAPASQQGMLNVTDAAGKVVRQIRAEDLPEAPVPITTSDLQTALATAVKPIVEKMDVLEKSMETGDAPKERASAVDKNVVEYIRVNGKEGKEDEHRVFLETLPDIAAIDTWTAKYSEIADKLFGSGGRKTEGVITELDAGSDAGDESDTTTDANPM